MMDFDRKANVVQRIQQNQAMYQMQQAAMMAAMGPVQDTEEAPTGGGSTESSDGESSITKNARERVANSTAPA